MADPPMREPLACVYSGGPRLVDRPPPAECPSSDPDAPFCGGACGESRTCPEIDSPFASSRIPPCVGVSDDRGFAVLRSACRAYARHHGEHAECVSASWERISG